MADTITRNLKATEVYNNEDNYTGILFGRQPFFTDLCVPLSPKSPPIDPDTSTPEMHLRDLVHRWNKGVYAVTDNKEQLSEDVCRDYRFLHEQVMNPRMRLWAAAVAQVLRDRDICDSEEKAVFSKTRVTGVPRARFRAKDSRTKFISIFCSIDGRILGRRTAEMKKFSTDKAAYYARVIMIKDQRRNHRIKDFQATNADDIDIRVTLVPL